MIQIYDEIKTKILNVKFKKDGFFWDKKRVIKAFLSKQKILYKKIFRFKK